MARRSMEELRAAEAAIKAAAAENRGALQRAKRARAADAKKWVVDGPMRRAVLAFFGLAHCNAEPAVEYLERCACERVWPAKPYKDMEHTVEDLFLNADLDEVAALANLENPADADALAMAVGYVEIEWKVVV